MACNLANAMPSLDQRKDLSFENKTMSEAFDLITSVLNINIETKGRIPKKSIDFSVENATKQQLLTEIMHAYSIKNFSLYFDNSTRTLRVTILDREEFNLKSAKIKNESTSNLVFVDSDITQVKTLTPEELKKLANASETGLTIAHTDNAEHVANPLNFEQLLELEEKYRKSEQSIDLLNFSPKTLSEEELHKLPRTSQFKLNELEQPTTLSSEVIQILKNKNAIDEGTARWF